MNETLKKAILCVFGVVVAMAVLFAVCGSYIDRQRGGGAPAELTDASDAVDRGASGIDDAQTDIAGATADAGELAEQTQHSADVIDRLADIIGRGQAEAKRGADIIDGAIRRAETDRAKRTAGEKDP